MNHEFIQVCVKKRLLRCQKETVHFVLQNFLFVFAAMKQTALRFDLYLTGDQQTVLSGC